MIRRCFAEDRLADKADHEELASGLFVGQRGEVSGVRLRSSMKLENDKPKITHSDPCHWLLTNVLVQ